MHYILLDLVCLCFIGIHGFSISNNGANQRNNRVEQIREAMQLTTRGQTNITAAKLACDTWNEILVTSKEEFCAQPKPIQVMCSALYASSLCRIGRDNDALEVYDDTLSLSMSKNDSAESTIDDSVLIDVKIGRAEALQRLMRYKEAGSEFLAICKLNEPKFVRGKIAKCAYSAALCSLRQNDFVEAEEILSSMLRMDRIEDLNEVDADLIGFYGALSWKPDDESAPKKINSKRDSFTITPLELLQYAASSSNASPVYQWFYAIASKSNCNIFRHDLASMDKLQLLHIVSINNSPFDDPALINVDDKINLHDLLCGGGTTLTQWPNGYILPRDRHSFEDFCSENPRNRWILKDRAGYGSHGNAIVTDVERIEHSDDAIDPKKFVLCQKLIEPSLLYHDRKFSIRVYVVYFKKRGNNHHDRLYLLREGLAKLAHYKYNDSDLNEDIFMTNSGRIEGDGMIQHSLQTLEAFIDQEHGIGTYCKIWKSINKSATDVMRAFLNFGDHNSYQNSLFSTVPKILGFDYIIDESLTPWLMEVNRFPGLEARGMIDTDVKNRVIETAWRLASRHSHTDCGLSPENIDILSCKVQELNVRDRE